MENKQNFEQLNNLEAAIKNSLVEQLKKMADRRPGRRDIKFKVLADFVAKLERQPFAKAFGELSPAHKHAIITRLENEAQHLGGQVPYEFIKKLEQGLYGVAVEDEEEMIDFKKKVELEEQLQAEDRER